MKSKNKKIKRKTHRKNSKHRIKSSKKINLRKKIKTHKKILSGGSGSGDGGSGDGGSEESYKYRNGEWYLVNNDEEIPLYDVLLELSKSDDFDKNKKIYSKLDGKIEFKEGDGVIQRYFKNTSVEEEEGDWYLTDDTGKKNIITDTQLDVTNGTIQFSAKETEFNKHLLEVSESTSASTSTSNTGIKPINIKYIITIYKLDSTDGPETKENLLSNIDTRDFNKIFGPLIKEFVEEQQLDIPKEYYNNGYTRYYKLKENQEKGDEIKAKLNDINVNIYAEIPIFYQTQKSEPSTKSGDTMTKEISKINIGLAPIIQTLQHGRNNCYMDTVLIMLFTIKNPIGNKIIESQKGVKPLQAFTNLFNTINTDQTYILLKKNPNEFKEIKDICPTVTSEMLCSYKYGGAGSAGAFLANLLAYYFDNIKASDGDKAKIYNFRINGDVDGDFKKEGNIINHTKDNDVLLDEGVIIISARNTSKYNIKNNDNNDVRKFEYDGNTYKLISFINIDLGAHFTVAVGNGEKYVYINKLFNNTDIKEEGFDFKPEWLMYVKDDTDIEFYNHTDFDSGSSGSSGDGNDSSSNPSLNGVDYEFVENSLTVGGEIKCKGEDIAKDYFDFEQSNCTKIEDGVEKIAILIYGNPGAGKSRCLEDVYKQLDINEKYFIQIDPDELRYYCKRYVEDISGISANNYKKDNKLEDIVGKLTEKRWTDHPNKKLYVQGYVGSKDEYNGKFIASKTAVINTIRKVNDGKNKLLELLLKENYHLVYNTSCTAVHALDACEKVMEKLISNNYKIILVGVHTKPEISNKRAKARMYKDGRFIDEQFLKDYAKSKPELNVIDRKLKVKADDSLHKHYIYNNNDDESNLGFVDMTTDS